MAMTTEEELEQVSVGSTFADGSFVDHGNYIIYTVASDDTLVGIGSRFGVNFMQIVLWNDIKDPNSISVGQQLTIYPSIIR